MKFVDFDLSGVTCKSIDIHGLNFLCVYGLYINGAFLSIINWGVSVELSSCEGDVYYNRTKILEALERSPDSSLLPSGIDAFTDIGRKLAIVIDDFLSETDF